MLKQKDNPPVQFPAGLAIEQFPDRWCVAHTRPRQEKALAWDILRSGGRYFLPMYEVTRKSRGRSWKSLLPLFSGYVFLCGSGDDRVQALTTNRVAKLIEVADQARLLGELSAIQRILESGMAVDPYRALKKGALCRVRTGPLAGLEGRVERRGRSTRFIVNVTMLGQGAMVEIDATFLEPAE